jgi:hypothetical protein
LGEHKHLAVQLSEGFSVDANGVPKSVSLRGCSR